MDLSNELSRGHPKYLYDVFDGMVRDKLYGVGFIEPGREVILVEGMMDVLRVWQEVKRSVFGILGARLHQEQVDWLKQNGVRKVILHLDGDKPGLMGKVRAIPILRGAGIITYVAGFPQGKNDPAECRRGELILLYDNILEANIWLRELDRQRRGDAIRVEKSAKRSLPNLAKYKS